MCKNILSNMYVKHVECSVDCLDVNILWVQVKNVG